MSGSKYRRFLRTLVKSCKNKACKDCGFKRPPHEMTYDHVRGKKLFNLGGSLLGLTEQIVRAEIAKCDVVCVWCHREREKERKRKAA